MLQHDKTREIKRISPTTAPVIWLEWEDLDEGIQWLKEAIWHGNMWLRELEEVGVRLRQKSARLDEEINKIKIGGTQMGHTNVKMRGLDLAIPPTILEWVVTLLSWLQLHPTEHESTYRDALLDSKGARNLG